MLYLRSLFFNILGYGILLFGCAFCSLIGLFVPQKAICSLWNDHLLIWSRRLLKLICGLEIEIRGSQYIQQGAAIYASKHQSAMETYYLTSYIKNATYIFKKELTHIPFFGWAVRFYGSVPVNRSGGSRAMKDMLAKAKQLLAQKRAIIIFPEGTRTHPGQTTEYKPGIAFLYQNTDAPVVPVALNTAFFWKKKSFLRYPGKVIIEFMEPMPRGLDKRTFMSELQGRIEKKCEELNKETLKNYPQARKVLDEYAQSDKQKQRKAG